MAEHPYWPVCEVRHAANGWLVRPGNLYERVAITSSDDFYVFQTWDECSKFLAEVTVPARPGPTVSGSRT